MVRIRIHEQEYCRNDGETVLDVLLKNKVNIPFSCQRGVCQTCLVQCTKGDIPERAQQGLSVRQIQKNYFLSCLCWPKSDMVISLPKETR